jgi:Flp pilus assembly protein TadG
MTFLKRLQRDERGMSFVYVGVGFMAFLSATTLAIDVGMFMTARTQAQTAADSGALAGAIALIKNNFNDRTPTGPAVQSAINTATTNLVMGAAPTVKPEDVTFPLSPAGKNNRVQVWAHQTKIPTLFGGFFGVKAVDVNAVAVAEASPANAMTCVKPFMIPDKWIEKVNDKCAPDGSWTTSSTYDEYNGKTNVKCSNPDVYVPAGDSQGRQYTGYTVANDVGTELVLRAPNQSAPNPSFYYSWKMPNDVGGDFYRENIANCNTSVMVYDPNNPTYMTQEPGSKQGPTIQGIQDLLAKDPSAEWNSTCKCIINSKFAQSPRLFPIPLFNPQYYAEGMATGRGASFMLANFLGFFVTSVDQQNGIHGIIAGISGTVSDTPTNVPADMFATAIRLVQ